MSDRDWRDRNWKVFFIGVGLSALAALAVFFIYMRWQEGEGSLLGQAEAWITANDLTIDLVTVWTLAVGFALLALIEITTWFTMVGQQDQTVLGKRLRPKKLGYASIFIGMSTLYSLTLYAYYQEHQFTVWSVFALRILVIVGIVAAAFFGARFILALRHEVWGWDKRDVQQGERQDRQDARDVSQQAREDQHRQESEAT